MPSKKVTDKKPKLVRRTVHALNIVVNPHPEGRYIEIFRSTMSAKTTFAFYGTRTGLINSFRKESGSDRFFRGTLALFSDINFDRSWLNFGTGEAAEKDDLESIKIPPHLRPEFQQILFVFDVVKHRMYFISNGLGITSARKLMEGLFISSNALNDTDELKITIIQDDDNLEQMLNERNIKHLEIEINLPNADSLKKAEQELYNRLRKQGAKSLDQKIEADSGNSLKPDEETKSLSKIALTNGKVTTKVQTNNGLVVRSTDKFPKMRKLVFDPMSSTEFDALMAITKNFD